MKYLTPSEILAVLKLARARSTRDWAMIVLTYRHGMRASEVCGLKLADVDLKGGRATIHDTKNGEQRTLPLAGKALHFDVTVRAVRAAGTDEVFVGRPRQIEVV